MDADISASTWILCVGVYYKCWTTLGLSNSKAKLKLYSQVKNVYCLQSILTTFKFIFLNHPH